MQSDSSQVSEGSQVERRPGGGGESLPGQGDGESRQGEKIFRNFCPGRPNIAAPMSLRLVNNKQY